MVAFMMRALCGSIANGLLGVNLLSPLAFVATNALGSTLGLWEVRRPKPLPSAPSQSPCCGHPAVPSGTSPAQLLGRRTEVRRCSFAVAALLHGAWSTPAECGNCAEFAHEEMMTD